MGDIELVQKNASLKRLAMQVNYHTELEEKLPAKLIEKVDRTELVIYPNGCVKSSIFSTVCSKYFFGLFILQRSDCCFFIFLKLIV